MSEGSRGLATTIQDVGGKAGFELNGYTIDIYYTMDILSTLFLHVDQYSSTFSRAEHFSHLVIHKLLYHVHLFYE